MRVLIRLVSELRSSHFCLLMLALLSGCGSGEQEIGCKPLIKDSGFYELKAIGSDIAMRLPLFSNIVRNQSLGCDKAKSISIDYLWFKEKLVSQSEFGNKIPKTDYMPVRIYYRDSSSSLKEISWGKAKAWRYENQVQHLRFPLNYYPQYFWDDPVSPSRKSLKRAKLDHIWGIRDTKYVHAGSGQPFTASCSIPIEKTDESTGFITSDFAVYGDSKCRGWVSADKYGRALYFMIDVWAYWGNDQQAVEQINKIYDAAVEELQSFIQE